VEVGNSMTLEKNLNVKHESFPATCADMNCVPLIISWIKVSQLQFSELSSMPDPWNFSQLEPS
jgi:hypothetical protein